MKQTFSGWERLNVGCSAAHKFSHRLRSATKSFRSSRMQERQRDLDSLMLVNEVSKHTTPSSTGNNRSIFFDGRFPTEFARAATGNALGETNSRELTHHQTTRGTADDESGAVIDCCCHAQLYRWMQTEELVLCR